MPTRVERLYISVISKVLAFQAKLISAFGIKADVRDAGTGVRKHASQPGCDTIQFSENEFHRRKGPVFSGCFAGLRMLEAGKVSSARAIVVWQAQSGL